MARLSDLGARFIGVYRWPPGPANAPIFGAGLVFAWLGPRGSEEIPVRFTTALDGASVPAKRRGADERNVRTGTDIETLTLATPVRFSAGVLTVANGEATAGAVGLNRG